MTIEFKRVATIPEFKSSFDEYYVTLDISTWLGDDTISSVSYSGIKDSDESDVSASILNSGKHTNTNTVIQPYIKGGDDGENYTVKMEVTTATGDDIAFYLKFTCREEP